MAQAHKCEVAVMVDSSFRGDNDSWMTAKSGTSSGDCGSELVENSTPPLVIISSRIKNSSQ